MTMSLFESAKAWIWSYQRLKELRAEYDAGRPSRNRRTRREPRSAAAAVNAAGSAIREQARERDQNDDLAVAVLNTLEDRVIGPDGILVEPLPRKRDGTIHIQLAIELSRLWDLWSEAPDVTAQYDRAEYERLVARSIFRDGEAFQLLYPGTVPGLNHNTKIPFSVQALESDYCPMEREGIFRAVAGDIYQGIEYNRFGRPIAYHFYETHPGSDRIGHSFPGTSRALAPFVLHGKLSRRFHQGRGVSVLAQSLARLRDTAEIEESARIKEKIGASIAAAIIKGLPERYKDNPQAEPRDLMMDSGVIMDDLAIGESIEVVDGKPQGNSIEQLRAGQLRAIAGGTGTDYSGIANDHNGTYTNARTEINKSGLRYRALTRTFARRNTAPNYAQFARVALMSGLIRSDLSDLDVETITYADYRGPVMPGPDPAKEFQAIEGRIKGGLKSQQDTIRELGGNPLDLLEQAHAWKEQTAERDLVFTTDARYSLPNYETRQDEEEEKA